MGRQAQITGLDPRQGALHAPAFGRASLACDLVEPLRPRIDLWVWNLFRARTLRPSISAATRTGAA
jgi:CRISPR-associated protein Cas1